MLFEEYEISSFGEKLKFIIPTKMSHRESRNASNSTSIPCASVAPDDDRAACTEKAQRYVGRTRSPIYKLEPRPIGVRGIQIVDKMPLTHCYCDDIAKGYLQEWMEFVRSNRDQDVAGEDKNAPITLAMAAAPPSFDPFTFSDLNQNQATAVQEVLVCYNSPQMQPPAYSLTYTSSAHGDSSLAKRRTVPQIHPHQDDKWDERYKQLKDFHRAHGHSVVPYNYKKFPPLAWWVKRQRHQMCLKQSGSHHTMTEEREQLLNKLDFVWETRAASWEQHFQELAMFKTNHGHLNISHGQHPKILTWARSQRKQLRLFWAGAKSSLTADQVQRLISLGFA
jgi:hypothetical protein